MGNSVSKIWLVRRRDGEILGPYSDKELYEAYQKRAFLDEDEVAKSTERWFSAANLEHHSPNDDLTRTQTRNQTVPTASFPSNGNGSSAIGQEARPKFVASSPAFEDEGLPEKSSRNFVKPIAVILLSLLLGGMILSGLKQNWRETGSDPFLPISNPIIADVQNPKVREAYQYIELGKRDEALKLLSQFHEQNQGTRDMEYLIPYTALLITERESDSRAEKLLQDVLNNKTTPSVRSQAHHWLGYLELLKNNGDMGELHFLESLQLNPKDPAARFNLGRAYLKQKRYSQALDYFNLAELEKPHLWLVHIYKGKVRAATGQFEEAKKAFKKAIECDPDRWMGYLYYAVFLHGIRQTEEAKKIFLQMLLRSPSYDEKNPPPWGYYEERVPYTEYLQSFNEMTQKMSEPSIQAARRYLDFLISERSESEARSIMELAKENQTPFIQFLYLRTLLVKEDADTPIANLLVQLNEAPKNLGTGPALLKAESLLKLRQPKEIQKEVDLILTQEPRSALAHWYNALAYRQLGESSDANRELKVLLQNHPTFIPALEALLK